MTCIVGITKNGVLCIGGDSAGVSHYSISQRLDKKVFRNGEFIIGFTTSYRMGQLLQYKFTPPPYDDRVDVMKYMVCDFIDGIRVCLKEGGFTTIDSGVETGGQFIVGFRSRLFKIDSDFQVGEVKSGMLTAGCGEQYALGAMHATKETNPDKIVTEALAVAEKLSAGVKAPFIIERMEYNDDQA